MQTVGEPLGVANEAGRARVLADADENPLARCPRTGDGVRLHLAEQLLVHSLGRSPQCKFAQSGQIGRREEMLERALGLFGNVDFPFFQPLNQIVGGEVDQLDGVGTIEHGIRHRFTHAHVGDLRHDVVEAFNVLNIDRGIDVDAAVHQLFDVEVAFRVAAPLHIGMGELVHQHDLRPPGDNAVEIHFLERLALVVDAPAGNDLEPRHQCFSLAPAMRLHRADNDVVAVLFARMRLLKHFVGLADAGGGADEDAKLADASFFAPRRFKQCFRRGPLFGCAPLIRHHRSDLSTSSYAALAGRQPVEREIEQQYVDARLAQKTDESLLDMLADELP